MGHSATGALDSVIQLPSAQANKTGFSSGTETEDHFIIRNGKEFAGTHLILDLWEATSLDNLKHMEAAMRESVAVSGATLLHIHLHHFTPSGGISGVAVLAESHISVHTWPERDGATLDVYVCNVTCDNSDKAEKLYAMLMQSLAPEEVMVERVGRGRDLPLKKKHLAAVR